MRTLPDSTLIIEPGHHYHLQHLDGEGETCLQFVQRQPLHTSVEGIIMQQLLRVCIDRVRELDKEEHWEWNEKIIEHARAMLALLETRALLVKVKKGKLKPEEVKTSPHDGHFLLERGNHA